MLDRQKFLTELEALVNVDSGTYCREGVNHVATWFADRFEALGWQSTWFEPEPEKLGKSVLCSSTADQHFDLLILCHVDTVFPEGEVASRPFAIEGDKLRGPGAADMKAGCLFALYALEQLVAEHAPLGKVGVFFNGEHEISCPNTRAIIERLSSQSRIVFSTEATRANGQHIRQRKGISRYTVRFTGVEAHSGNNPQDGVCAVTELAHWVLFFKSLEEPSRGITVNTGMVQGGVSVNTIPKDAELRVDIRTVELEDAQRLDAVIKARQPFDSRVSVHLAGGISRPPMRPNPQTDILCEMIDAIGAKHGIVSTGWAFAGGGSDASFASAMGKPALCGIGPVGGGAHTRNEFVDTRDLEARFAEFKDIVQTLSTTTAI